MIGARILVATTAVLTLAGCPKSEENKTAPAASGSAAPHVPAASGSAPAPASDAGTASAPAKPAGQAATYAGTYSLAPAPMYIPQAKDWASVKQAKDDPTKHIGDGALSLAVDGNGKVTGTIDSGPAGPGVIDGSVIDGELRGVVRRKDPKDEGLTGTFLGKVSGDAVEGKLSLAEANAAIVREGKFSLKTK